MVFCRKREIDLRYKEHGFSVTKNSGLLRNIFMHSTFATTIDLIGAHANENHLPDGFDTMKKTACYVLVRLPAQLNYHKGAAKLPAMDFVVNLKVFFS
jgi:hypothetical protein